MRVKPTWSIQEDRTARLTASALGAPVVLLLLRNVEPDGVVRVGRIAGAADLALGELFGVSVCDFLLYSMIIRRVNPECMLSCARYALLMRCRPAYETTAPAR